MANGGGKKASVRGYRVAGKTGTAQKVNEFGTTYAEGKYIASFCGFAPVENPQVTLLVVIDEPYGSFYGGQIAAPVAGRILSQVLRYLRIEPSNSAYIDVEELGDDVGEGDSAGSATVLNQRISTPEEVEEVQEEVTTPEPENVPEGSVVVPNFRRKSIREVAGMADDLGLVLEGSGSGFAIEQSIDAGEVVERGTRIRVEFSP